MPTYSTLCSIYFAMLLGFWHRYQEKIDYSMTRLLCLQLFCMELLAEGDEGSYLPNCQTNMVIDLHELYLLFWHFISTTALLLTQDFISS